MGRMTCELMAGKPALITSTRSPGKRSSSIASRNRLKPKEGSGSPCAADSPRTKTRKVPAALCAGKANEVGARAIPGGKKRPPKSGFSQ